MLNIFFLLLTATLIQGRLFLRGITSRCIDGSQLGLTCAQMQRDSLMPNPNDCRMYYYCMDGEEEPFCYQCPMGLHFSPIHRNCLEPSEALCIIATTKKVIHEDAEYVEDRFNAYNAEDNVNYFYESSRLKNSYEFYYDGESLK